MTKRTITCDSQGGLCRAAVWEGKALLDLYVNRLEDPDLSGALVRGRVVRVASGEKAGWIEAGLPEKIYCEDEKGLRTGEVRNVLIRSTMRQGKAWLGASVPGGAGETGLLTPPPSPWERAFADHPDASLHFEDRADYEAFGKLFPEKREQALLPKEPVHPELDEIIDGLLQKRIELSPSGSIVIEETEAFVAIDVNAGEKGDAAAVNFAALKEIVRQIRLRSLSGLIVIDALKMKNRTDNAKLLNVFERAVSGDPSGVPLFNLTKLGLIEAVRTRRGPPLTDFFGGF